MRPPGKIYNKGANIEYNDAINLFKNAAFQQNLGAGDSDYNSEFDLSLEE